MVDPCFVGPFDVDRIISPAVICLKLPESLHLMSHTLKLGSTIMES